MKFYSRPISWSSRSATRRGGALGSGTSAKPSVRAIADRVLKTPVTLRPTAPLAPAAASIALALDHAIYDCFYLALAEIEGMRLATADRRFLAKLPGTHWQDYAILLERA
jgi:predicted nucleic acid-binding protein